MKEDIYSVRQMQSEDLDKIMEIWLESNQQAHSFLSADYWEKKSEPVREMIKQAEIYVACFDGMPTGFIGLDDGYIAGIFVSELFRGRGIGTSLLTKAKRLFRELRLHVYVKNKQAVEFYKSENFSICRKTVEEETKEEEYLMVWKRDRIKNSK